MQADNQPNNPFDPNAGQSNPANPNIQPANPVQGNQEPEQGSPFNSNGQQPDLPTGNGEFGVNNSQQVNPNIDVQTRGQNQDAGFVESGNPFEKSPAPSPAPAPNQGQYQQQPHQTPADTDDVPTEDQEVQRLKNELQQARQYEEFGHMVEQDPKLMGMINDHVMGGGQGSPQQQQQQQPKELTPPELPEDLYDRQAMESYNREMADYQQKLATQKAEEIADSRIDSFQTEQQKAIEQQQTEQYLNRQKQELKQRYGQEDLSDFEQWADDPNNLSMDTLYRLYQIEQGGEQQQQDQPGQYPSQNEFNQGQHPQQPQPGRQNEGNQPQMTHGGFQEHQLGQIPGQTQQQMATGQQGYPTPMTDVPAVGSQQQGASNITDMIQAGARQANPTNGLFRPQN